MKAIKIVLITLIAIHSYPLQAEEEKKDPKEFLGMVLPKELHHPDHHSIRDLFVEDVPGAKSYWLGPWVKTVAVNGINRFYTIKGYNRYYVNAAFLKDSQFQFLARSSGTYDFYGPFEGKPNDHFKLPAESGRR